MVPFCRPPTTQGETEEQVKVKYVIAGVTENETTGEPVFTELEVATEAVFLGEDVDRLELKLKLRGDKLHLYVKNGANWDLVLDADSGAASFGDDYRAGLYHDRPDEATVAACRFDDFKLTTWSAALSSAFVYDTNNPYLLNRHTKPDGSYVDYDYDANGDMTSMQRRASGGALLEDWGYQYSDDRYVKKVTLGGVTKREYERQGDSYMVRRDFTAGNEKRYVRDGDSVLVELNDSNQVTATYFGGGMDKMLSETRGGVTKWNLAGPGGSVMAVADVSGDIVSQFRYDAFGKRNAASSGIDPVAGQRTFQGRPHDEGLGLTNFRNRWYDPETGRFAQWDRVEDAGNWGNPFNFAGCDPVNNADPMGDVWEQAVRGNNNVFVWRRDPRNPREGNEPPAIRDANNIIIGRQPARAGWRVAQYGGRWYSYQDVNVFERHRKGVAKAAELTRRQAYVRQYRAAPRDARRGLKTAENVRRAAHKTDETRIAKAHKQATGGRPVLHRKHGDHKIDFTSLGARQARFQQAVNLMNDFIRSGRSSFNATWRFELRGGQLWLNRSMDPQYTPDMEIQVYTRLFASGERFDAQEQIWGFTARTMQQHVPARDYDADIHNALFSRVVATAGGQEVRAQTAAGIASLILHETHHTILQIGVLGRRKYWARYAVELPRGYNRVIFETGGGTDLRYRGAFRTAGEIDIPNPRGRGTIGLEGAFEQWLRDPRRRRRVRAGVGGR